jgi:hypothetical protein
MKSIHKIPVLKTVSGVCGIATKNYVRVSKGKIDMYN